MKRDEIIFAVTISNRDHGSDKLIAVWELTKSHSPNVERNKPWFTSIMQNTKILNCWHEILTVMLCVWQ